MVDAVALNEVLNWTQAIVLILAVVEFIRLLSAGHFSEGVKSTDEAGSVPFLDKPIKELAKGLVGGGDAVDKENKSEEQDVESESKEEQKAENESKKVAEKIKSLMDKLGDPDASIEDIQNAIKEIAQVAPGAIDDVEKKLEDINKRLNVDRGIDETEKQQIEKELADKKRALDRMKRDVLAINPQTHPTERADAQEKYEQAVNSFNDEAKEAERLDKLINADEQLESAINREIRDAQKFSASAKLDLADINKYLQVFSNLSAKKIKTIGEIQSRGQAEEMAVIPAIHNALKLSLDNLWNGIKKIHDANVKNNTRLNALHQIGQIKNQLSADARSVAKLDAIIANDMRKAGSKFVK